MNAGLLATSPLARPGRPALRELRPDDHAGVQALLRRHGVGVRSHAGWRWALFDNPAHQALGGPAGWVLCTADGAVVGFLGNLKLHYRAGPRALTAATCSTCVVDAAHAAHAAGLLRAFARQPGVDFVHVLAADERSARGCETLGFIPAHDPRLDTRLRWVANEAALVRLGLKRLGLQTWQPLVQLAAPSRRLWRRWRGTGNPPAGSRSLRVERLAAEDLGDEWDDWSRRFSDRPGLWADRSAAAMAWRLGDPDLAEDLALFAVRDTSGLLHGMCLARLLPGKAGEPATAMLLDWALMPAGGASHAARLLGAVLQWAGSWGASVLDASRLSGEAHDQLAALGPQVATLPSRAAWCRLRSNTMLDEPAVMSGWSITGIDGGELFDTRLDAERPDRTAWRGPPASPWPGQRPRLANAADVRGLDSEPEDTAPPLPDRIDGPRG